MIINGLQKKQAGFCRMKALIILPYDGFFMPIEDLLISISKRFGEEKVCYISLNKTYTYLSGLLEKAGVSPKAVLVVDVASKAFNPEDEFRDGRGCIYLGPQDVISGLKGVQERLMRGEFMHVIVDSLSSLMVYHTVNEVMDYMKGLADISAIKGISLYFFCGISYSPVILNGLERAQVLMAKQHDNEFLLKFGLDMLMEIEEKIKKATEAGDMAKSRELYDHAMGEYRKISSKDIDENVRKEVFRRFSECREKMKAP